MAIWQLSGPQSFFFGGFDLNTDPFFFGGGQLWVKKQKQTTMWPTWIAWKDVARCVSGRSGPPVSEWCWRSAGLHGRGAGEVRKLSGKDLISRSGQKYFAVWRDLFRSDFLNCPPTKMKMDESLNLSDLHNKLMLLHIDVFSSLVWERFLRLRQVIINLGCLGSLANSTLLPFDMPCLDSDFDA